MFMKSFMEFTNESYLSGSRAPIYHYTGVYRIVSIIKSDELRMGNPCRPKGSKAICLTRSPYFTHDGGASNDPRLVLDIDKLRNDGYISYPFDEIGSEFVKKNRRSGTPNSKEEKNFIKSNFQSIKSGQRNVNHGLNLPKVGSGMEVELEERIYKDIKNIGKYIISIEFVDDPIRIYPELSNYLKKYTDIKINLYNEKKRNKTTDITSTVMSDKVLSKL